MSRKDAKLTIEDNVDLYVDVTNAPVCEKVFSALSSFFCQHLRQPLMDLVNRPTGSQIVFESSRKVLDETIIVVICKK